MAQRQCGKSFTVRGEEYVRRDYKRVCSQLAQGIKRFIEILFGARLQNMDLQSKGTSRWSPCAAMVIGRPLLNRRPYYFLVDPPQNRLRNRRGGCSLSSATLRAKL